MNDLGHNLGHTLEHVAEGAFNAAAKAATGIAQPAFDIVHHVAATGMHLIAQQLPFLPEGARKAIESASRIVMRARLGDIKAKDFIHGIIHAVKSGVNGARKIGDALLTGSRLVAHVLDVPMRIMEHIPGVGGVMKNFSPFEKFAKMTTLVQRGDFSGLKKMVTDDVKMAQGVISLFPGIGTGISSALSAGMAILDGGGPLEIAIKTAYGAIPIPPGVRTITDAVLDGVLTLATKHGSLTDAVLAAARDAVPNGFPRQVFDTLANLVIKHRPIAKVAGDLLNHYVGQYVGQIKVGGEIPTHDVDVAAVTHSTRSRAAPRPDDERGRRLARRIDSSRARVRGGTYETRTLCHSSHARRQPWRPDAAPRGRVEDSRLDQRGRLAPVHGVCERARSARDGERVPMVLD